MDMDTDMDTAENNPDKELTDRIIQQRKIQ